MKCFLLFSGAVLLERSDTAKPLRRRNVAHEDGVDFVMIGSSLVEWTVGPFARITLGRAWPSVSLDPHLEWKINSARFLRRRSLMASRNQ